MLMARPAVPLARVACCTPPAELLLLVAVMVLPASLPSSEASGSKSSPAVALGVPDKSFVPFDASVLSFRLPTARKMYSSRVRVTVVALIQLSCKKQRVWTLTREPDSQKMRSECQLDDETCLTGDVSHEAHVLQPVRRGWRYVHCLAGRLCSRILLVNDSGIDGLSQVWNDISFTGSAPYGPQ
jgi:hypothetical protein